MLCFEYDRQVHIITEADHESTLRHHDKGKRRQRDRITALMLLYHYRTYRWIDQQKSGMKHWAEVNTYYMYKWDRHWGERKLLLKHWLLQETTTGHQKIPQVVMVQIIMVFGSCDDASFIKPRENLCRWGKCSSQTNFQKVLVGF